MLDVNKAIQGHNNGRDPSDFVDLSQHFRRYGVVRITNILPPAIPEIVLNEVYVLLDQHGERRDLELATTGFTPRAMTVVRSEAISKCELISSIYLSLVFRALVERIAGEPINSCPSADEEFLITRHEKKGDTHGWHWGDFSFAVIWVLQAPEIEAGGLLQVVPHTNWDKSNPRINHYLCDNPVHTFYFKSREIYLLRTDTTLHRTIPLTRDTTRIILNMTYASAAELSRRSLAGNDRWWEDPKAAAARGTA